ncbi:hypothetical protein ABPG74_020327 [Tetrahymena malaccensis]
MKGMQTKEDCPYKWITVFIYVFAILILYYSLMEFSTLYGVYKTYFNIPNFDFHFNCILSAQYLSLFMVILYVGVITDKYGPGFCFLMQAIIITFGQILVCVSVYTKFFYLMYLARCCICIGCSSIAVSKGVYCRDYFHSTHLALTNSMTSMSFTLSQITNLYFVWLVYNHYNILIVELFDLFLCILGLILVYFIYRVDAQNNRYLNLYNYKTDYQNLNFLHSSKEKQIIDSHQQVELKQNANNKGYQISSEKQDVYVSQLQINFNQQKKEDKNVVDEYLKDLKDLKKSYWVGNITVAVAYVSLMSYVMLGPAICQQYMGLTPQESSYYVAFLPNITLIMPLVGRIIDHYKSWFNIFYIISFLAVAGSLLLLFQIPIAAFLAIGMAYGSRTTGEFPLICFLSDKKIAGRAYSISRATSNMLLSIMLFINSMIVEYTHSYLYTQIILLSCGLLVSILITIVKYLHHQEVKIQSNQISTNN